eukprot:scaffold114654_cov48-Phaeocystis_antarctica.AAC.1
MEVRTRLWARFFCGSTQRAKLRLPVPRANRAITRPRRPPRYRARLAPPRPLARLSSRAMGRTLRRPGGFVGGPGLGQHAPAAPPPFAPPRARRRSRAPPACGGVSESEVEAEREDGGGGGDR